ncbi:mediator of RNA polymerase II transcription subunit 13 [Actinomortierella wolfii]|nr:mediator of RNA polymerase II transcription subunit 13 [Actinomortierella wolfii]
MSDKNEVITNYPTERVFVTVPLKEAPGDAGGSDGLGLRNLGFIEDLGAKFTTWAWQEKSWNASILPTVPKLIPPIVEQTPVLAEPRNRLKAGSSAWQQQQHMLQQQQLQQQQQQQKQQKQQSIFLQQQLDAYQQREAGNHSGSINRLDYWEYTDPHSYLTSLVLNSCANMDAKILEVSPMEQESSTTVALATPSARSRLTWEYKKKEEEAEGWVRRPTTNSLFAPPVVHDSASTTTTPVQNGLLRNDQASESGQPISSTGEAHAKQPAVQPDGSSTATNLTGSNFSLPIDMPNEIPELMDMNPMMRMFGSSNTNDLEDWDTQEITEDDFSFFDEQPRRSRAMPVLDPLSSAFDSLPETLSTSVSLPALTSTTSEPTTSSSDLHELGPLSTSLSAAIPTTPIPTTIGSLSSVENMFMDMEFDMATFTQPTPPLSTHLPLPRAEKTADEASVALATEDTTAFLTGSDSQTPGPQNVATPHPVQIPISAESLITASPAEKLSTTAYSTISEGAIITSSPTSALDPTTAQVETMSISAQNLIPRSFSPLRIVSGPSVDDAKYQPGGRFMFKPLFKRRRSYIRDRSKREPTFFPLSIYGPQYHPGLSIEISLPDVKIRRKLSIGGIRRPSLPRRRAMSIPQLGHISAVGASSHHTIQTLTEQTTTPHTLEAHMKLATIKDERESSSSSESEDGDGSYSSEEESGDESALREPRVGEITFHSPYDGRRRWTARGISSARLAATALSSWTHREFATGVFGLTISLPTLHVERWPSTTARSMKVWSSTEMYHRDSEYDTPFLPVIFAAAPPALVKERTALQEAFAVGYFYDSVRVLCEQTILGEYPFAESNETIGSSGDISEGLSFHATLARRRTMIDTLFGGIPSIPALCDDSLRKAIEIKAVVFQALEHLRCNQNDTPALPVPSEAAQEMGMSAVHHQPTQSSIVTMKGPLSLSQYSSLAEVQPTATKYGKFQVKKKKSAEPSLFQMSTPDIVVGHNDEWLEASPVILRFWEKLSLEPYSAKKNIVYYILYPEGTDTENAVIKFWKELSSLFETSLLGQHLPGDVPDGKPGLCPVPLLPSIPGETLEARQVRSLVEGSRKLGTLLGSSSQKDVYTVVYMVNPFSHGAGYFDLARCFSVLKGCFISSLSASQPSASVIEQQKERLVLQMVPIHHVLYPAAFGGFLRFGLRQMAFSVYQRCKVALERPSQSSQVNARTSIYAPAFALAKTAPATINYSRHLKPNTAPRNPATMHVGYSLSLDERWLVCVWTDHRGEMLEHLELDLKGCRHGLSVSVVTTTASNGQRRKKEQDSRRTQWTMIECMQEIWAKTQLYQKRASFSWKTVITKLGLISQSELAEWTAVTKDAQNVSIVAVNIDSPMRIYPHGRGISDYVASGTTPAGSNVTTPNLSGILSQGIPTMSTPNLNSSTTTPLPNISAMSSTPGSTPTPTTPMSAGTLGVNGILGAGLGLGIAGAASMNMSGTGTGLLSASPGVTSATTGAVGGDSLGGEVLENGSNQMYGMVLNHRMPLVIPGHDPSVMLFSRAARPPSSVAGGDMSSASSSSLPSSSTSASATPDTNLSIVKTEEVEDHSMGKPIKMEEGGSSNSSAPRTLEASQEGAKGDQGKTADQSSLDESSCWTRASGNEIVLPLATGYLMQAPIHTSTAIREKHSLESLGVEVHLVAHVGHHNQVASTADQQQPQHQRQQHHLTTGANANSPGYNTASSLYGHQSSPYAPVSSPSLNSYQGSSLMNGSAASPGVGSSGNTAASGQQGVSLGIASTSSLNVLRDLLKQFHALSHLSLASVPTNCLPLHLVLLERLSRVLLLVKD